MRQERSEYSRDRRIAQYESDQQTTSASYEALRAGEGLKWLG